MIKKQFVINSEAGLHARPATLFVNTSKKYNSEIQVTKGEKKADAKKFLQVLSLGALKGDKISIDISGDDEKEAVVALEQLIDNNFVE
ncbi:HPr family phosphocarrier protein [Vallitalea okinawensis]|uniref:HPr family phosphocarrier protein n=1 Tax=Vallitalea okinawensis TaxID=2078660 RepID=UPI000CFE2D1C|nr:HPr family phosphocarrier protein [Vallitalea okinawensis]